MDRGSPNKGFAAVVDANLDRHRRTNRRYGCALPAFGAEISRSCPATRRVAVRASDIDVVWLYFAAIEGHPSLPPPKVTDQTFFPGATGVHIADHADKGSAPSSYPEASMSLVGIGWAERGGRQ
jgi:hypothetical protein